MRVVVLWLALLLSGCSTINRDLAFDGTDGTALVVVASDGMNGGESYSFVFQKVDLGQEKFLPDHFFVYFSGLGTLEGDEFTKPKELSTTLRFGGKKATPGYYVLTSRVDHAAYGFVSSTKENCFALGAATFLIEGGAVNVVPVGHVHSRSTPDGALLQSQATTVLSTYPGVSAPLRVAEMVGVTMFERTKGRLWGDICVGDTMSFESLAPRHRANKEAE